jgi:hypothetical protein
MARSAVADLNAQIAQARATASNPAILPVTATQPIASPTANSGVTGDTFTQQQYDAYKQSLANAPNPNDPNYWTTPSNGYWVGNQWVPASAEESTAAKAQQQQNALAPWQALAGETSTDQTQQTAANPLAGIDLNAYLSGGGSGGGGAAPAGFQYSGEITPGAFSGPTLNVQPWQAPAWTLGDFVAPTAADVGNDPGYQFRVKEGQDALERSAAAKGTLLTGGTLKDLESYAQDLASTEYDKMYDRAVQQYQLKYQSANDAWNRSLQEYTTNFDTLFKQQQANYQAARDSYAFRQQDDITNYNVARQAWEDQQQAQAQADASAAADQRAREAFLMQLAGL